jgi:hypothetical protein
MAFALFICAWLRPLTGFGSAGTGGRTDTVGAGDPDSAGGIADGSVRGLSRDARSVTAVRSASPMSAAAAGGTGRLVMLTVTAPVVPTATQPSVRTARRGRDAGVRRWRRLDLPGRLRGAARGF